MALDWGRGRGKGRSPRELGVMPWEHGEAIPHPELEIQGASRRKPQLKGDLANNWESATGHRERSSREEIAQVNVEKVKDAMWYKNAGWPLSHGSALEGPEPQWVGGRKLIRVTVSKLRGGQCTSNNTFL